MSRGGPQTDRDALRKALIASARADAPPTRAMAKTLVALGVASASTGAAGTAAAASSIARVVAWKWFVGGALLSASAIGVYEVAEPEPGPPPPPPVPTVAVPSASERVERVPAAPIDSVAPEPSAAAPVLRRAPVRDAGQDAPSGSGLAREIELLDEARRAVQGGDVDAGLEALQRYARECDAAQLGHEATALRVQALQSSGRCGEARRVGEAFLRSHPDSPVAKRIRSLLASCRADAG